MDLREIRAHETRRIPARVGDLSSKDENDRPPGIACGGLQSGDRNGVGETLAGAFRNRMRHAREQPVDPGEASCEIAGGVEELRGRLGAGSAVRPRPKESDPVGLAQAGLEASGVRIVPGQRPALSPDEDRAAAVSELRQGLRVVGIANDENEGRTFLDGDHVKRFVPFPKPSLRGRRRRKLRAVRDADGKPGQLARSFALRVRSQNHSGARDDGRRELDLGRDQMDGVGGEPGQPDSCRRPDVERPSVESDFDSPRLRAEKALPRQPDGHGAPLGVALEEERRLGGRARDVQPLPRSRHFAPGGIEGACDELVRRELPAQVHVGRPGLSLEAGRGTAVELEGDRGGRSFDRDADWMGSEDETEEERREGDRGQLAIVETAAGRRPFERAAEIRFLGRSVMRTIQSPNPSLASSTR